MAPKTGTNTQLTALIDALDVRVTALENAPAGTVDLTAVNARIAALEAEVAAIKALTCPEDPRLAAIEAEIAALKAQAASEAAAQDALELDHTPML